MAGSAAPARTDAAVDRTPMVRRTICYTLIGGFCAVTNNAIIILGGWHGLPYGATIAAAFVITTPLAYCLNVRFTFRSHASWSGLTRFAAGLAGGVAFMVLALAALHSGLDVPLAVAAPLITILGYGWNFTSAHWAIGGWRLRTALRSAPR